MRLHRTLSAMLASLALLLPSPQSAANAQSILRDAETERLLKDLANPLIDAAGLDRRSVQIILINDPSINAFVAGGQAIYIHSGLINAADGLTGLRSSPSARGGRSWRC